jgi:polygalacturonase
MPVNTFQGFNAESITPDDSTNITIGGSTIDGLDNGVCLYVGTGGDIKVTMVGNQVVTFSNVPNGSFLPIQVKRVWATDTTASDLLGLY